MYRSYNAGDSEDLSQVISYVLSNFHYTQLALKGFSLGGNIVLKYMGEDRIIPKEIIAAVGISVPCDLKNSLEQLNKPKNFLYTQLFLKNLKQKLYDRQLLFPKLLSKIEIDQCKTLKDVDDLYTSKAHGYKNALDYYTKCSSKQFLSYIKIPTFILNAKNDSFLGTNCYPYHEAFSNPNLYLETPNYGGHVGFVENSPIFYNEKKSYQFISNILIK